MVHEQVLKIYIPDKDLREQYIEHIEEHNRKQEEDEYSDSGFDLLSPEKVNIKNNTVSQMVDLQVKTSLVIRRPVDNPIMYDNSIILCGGLASLFILLNQCVLGIYVSLLLFGAIVLSDNKHIIEDYYTDQYTESPVPFMLLPRSSTGKKTPLRLTNSMGVIDKGYRGNLKVCLDNVNNTEVEEGSIFSSPAETEDYYTIEQYKKLFQIVAFSGEQIRVEIVNSIHCLSKTNRGEGGFGSTDDFVEVCSTPPSDNNSKSSDPQDEKEPESTPN